MNLLEYKVSLVVCLRCLVHAYLLQLTAISSLAVKRLLSPALIHLYLEHFCADLPAVCPQPHLVLLCSLSIFQSLYLSFCAVSLSHSQKISVHLGPIGSQAAG